MYIEIDGNTRKIKITQEQRLFGVVQDCNAERKYFKMPRIIGNNIDVTKCIIYIVYQKSDEVGNIYYGEPNTYICEDVVLDETEQKVTFSWELTKDIFDISGYLGFKILVEHTDDDGNVKNVWNTIPEFGIICKSMFGDKIQHIQEQNKDIVGRLLQDLKQIKNDMKMKITQPDVAKEGQTFRIKQINEDGTLVVEAVDMTSGGVTDVQIDGTSIVGENGVAEIPNAKNGIAGLVAPYKPLGTNVQRNGILTADSMTTGEYDKASASAFIGKGTLETSKYNIVKKALSDGKGEAWTAEEQAAARERMGIPSGVLKMIADQQTDITELKSDLTDIVYNNDLDSLDHSKTYLYYHMTQGQFDFRGAFSNLVGVTEIDWGDGSKTTEFTPENNLKHIYTEAGDYIITIHGITSIKNTGFHGHTKLYKAVLADTVSSIGKNCFNENDVDMEVHLFSEHFPTITDINAFASCKKLYFKSDRYINYRNDLMDMLGIDTVFNRTNYGILAAKLYPIDENKIIYTDKIVTVGENGDFKSLNEALEVLSQFYPVYKKDFYGVEDNKKGTARWGVNCEIRILAGTVINEQVFVKQMDLQWITITAEADSDHTETVTIDGTSHTVAIVDVDATGFTYTADAHDSRGNYPFMACENAGKFPTIGCLFRLLPDTVETGKSICGLLCNRGSEGVVLAGSGFDGFYDGVIANNESSITIREGISRNMTRWGVHARHNGEVSARSCVCTNCGVGACADRVADLDVREAVLDGSTVAIECNNISRVNANGCHANNCGSSSYYIVKVSGGGFANCGSLETTGAKGNVFSQNSNTLTANGIIFA